VSPYNTGRNAHETLTDSRQVSSPTSGMLAGMVETVPIEAFLEAYPEPIRNAANRLRALVRQVEPGAIEGVREGWRIIGYDIRVGRRTRYFAWIGPEPRHVHIGFQHGVLMADPKRRLRGAHLHLKNVRYLTFTSADQIDDDEIVAFVREAVRINTLSRAEQQGLAADAWEPADSQ
jgi:hypothetical protein